MIFAQNQNEDAVVGQWYMLESARLKKATPCEIPCPMCDVPLRHTVVPAARMVVRVTRILDEMPGRFALGDDAPAGSTLYGCKECSLIYVVPPQEGN